MCILKIVLFIKWNLGDQIEEDDMEAAYDTHGGYQK
jgi:hypothetical protein